MFALDRTHWSFGSDSSRAPGRSIDEVAAATPRLRRGLGVAAWARSPATA